MNFETIVTIPIPVYHYLDRRGVALYLINKAVNARHPHRTLLDKQIRPPSSPAMVTYYKYLCTNSIKFKSVKLDTPPIDIHTN